MSDQKENIIAIDGPAGSGKSSITKMMANKYSFNHIDTGALFRVIALLLDKNQIKEEAIADFLSNLDLTYDNSGKDLVLKYDNEDYSTQIREHHVSSLASKYSQNKLVRAKVEELEKKIVSNSSKISILEGRDIGSFVFPNAILKIFLTASVEVRAKRRMDELIEKENIGDLTFENLVEDIKQRDFQDSHREHAPLVQAKDAVLIDTSNLSVPEVIEKISNLIEEKGLA